MIGLKATLRSMVNVKSWIGWGTLKHNSAWISASYRQLFQRPTQPEVKQTFAQAIEQYQYTPEFLANQEASFRKAAIVYLAVLSCGVSYMLFLFVKKNTMAFLMMLPINLILFICYFRESFWLMQLRHKRLGMTFNDWVNIVMLKNV